MPSVPAATQPLAAEHLDPLQAGEAIARLWAAPERCFHRRVERVEHLHYAGASRHVRVDLSLDRELFSSLTYVGGVVVPITTLPKYQLAAFAIECLSGQRATVLGHAETVRFTVIALLHHASRVLAANPELPSREQLEALERDIRVIVEAPDAVAVEHLDKQLRDRPGLWARLADEQDLCSHLSVFAAQFVLYATVDAAPGEPVSFAFSFPASNDPDHSVPDGVLAAARRVLDFVRRDTWTIAIECPHALTTASWHLSVILPEELKVVDCDADSIYGLSHRAHGTFQWHRHSAQVHVTHDPDEVRSAPTAGVIREPSVDIQVTAALHAGPVRALITAVVVAGTLFAGWATTLDALNPAPAVSIILAGTALFAGMSAQGQPPLAQITSRLRHQLLVVLSLIALTCAVLLVFSTPETRPVTAWLVGSIASAAIGVRLLCSVLRSRTV